MLINNTLINCKKHRITLILKKIYVKNLFSLYRLNSLDLNKYFNFAFNTYINCF